MAVKQVIVIRKDLKMRRGKEIAQGSHASMKWLVDRIKMFQSQESAYDNLPINISDEEQEWLDGRFTKVCLQVESEEELMKIFSHAASIGLTTNLIVDAGATEFHNVPTRTCLAIGPHEEDKIKPVTGHLKLY